MRLIFSAYNNKILINFIKLKIIIHHLFPLQVGWAINNNKKKSSLLNRFKKFHMKKKKSLPVCSGRY